MTKSAETLRGDLKRAEDSLLGFRLLAIEIAAELRVLREHVNSPGPSRSMTAAAVASLKHIDSMLKPMTARRRTS